jgi:quercetin dioxygenase-like cupin family protein
MTAAIDRSQRTRKEVPMSGDQSKVVTTESVCACQAVHTHHVHHRDFPEVHVEGLSPGDAASHLKGRLTSILDTTSSDQHRDRVRQAIEDVESFVEANPPTGLRAAEPASEPTLATVEASAVHDVRPLGSMLTEARSAPLVKTAGMEVIRLVMRQGKSIPTHKAPGEATILCLEGHVDFHVGGQTHRIGPGQLIHLQDGEPHAVVALEDSSLLVTAIRK